MERKIDDLFHGEFINCIGERVTAEESTSAMRWIDFFHDACFAMGAGAVYTAMESSSHVINEVQTQSLKGLAVAGFLVASYGFSQRITTAIMRYAANRGTYSSFFDLIRRV